MHSQPRVSLPRKAPHRIQFQELFYTVGLISLFKRKRRVRVRGLTGLVTAGLGKINPNQSRLYYCEKHSLLFLQDVCCNSLITTHFIPFNGCGRMKELRKAPGSLSKERARSFFAPASCVWFSGDLIKVNM